MKLVFTGKNAKRRMKLADTLSERLSIPVFHGIEISQGIAEGSVANDTGRFRRNEDEIREITEAILAEESWIWEGNYEKNQRCFFESADLIFSVKVFHIVRKEPDCAVPSEYDEKIRTVRGKKDVLRILEKTKR